MSEKSKAPSALDELDKLQNEYEEQIAAIKIAASKSGGDGYTLELYSPIMVGSEKRHSIHFRAQTVRDMREIERRKKADPSVELDDLLASTLSDMSVDQLQQLDWLDYASVQAVIVGFHLRRASGGLARKA